MSYKPNGTYSEGGWGWTIVLGGFTIMFIFNGTLKAFGVLLITIKDDFDTDLWIIGSLGFLHYGLFFVMGPVAGSVARRTGSRYLVVFGGMLYGLGLTLASTANSVILLGVSLIVMAGLGAGCVYETCRVELVFYFHDKFPLAYLLLTIGGPVGMMVYGPLTQVLLDTYGWRGTMLILGGVSFHVVICGLLLRPGKHSLKDYNKVPLDGDEVKHPNRGAYSPVYCFHKLLMIAGLDVFRNVEFLILSCARMFINIGHAGVIIYMVPNGLSLGLNTTEASFLTSAWGFGSIIGLSLSAFITQRKFISNHLTAGISGLISAVCFAASPFLTTVTCQFLNLTLLSVGTEGVAQVLAVNTRNLPFSDDQQFNVVGWQCFLVGMSCTIGDIIAGWLYDATGSFQATFFMFCGTSVVTCVCLLVDLIRLRFIGQRDE